MAIYERLRQQTFISWLTYKYLLIYFKILLFHKLKKIVNAKKEKKSKIIKKNHKINVNLLKKKLMKIK